MEPVLPMAPSGGVPRQPGWWRRNWLWAVPLGCLGLPILCCAGGLGGLFFLIGAADKSTEPYIQAVARTRADPRVRQALGEPIRIGFWVTGGAEYGTMGKGMPPPRVDAFIPISGPLGSGTIHVTAKKEADG